MLLKKHLPSVEFCGKIEIIHFVAALLWEKILTFRSYLQAWPHQQLSSLLSVYYHLFQFSIIFCNFECWLRVLLRITYSTSVIIPLSVLENTAANGVTPPLSVTSREDGECSTTKAHHHHHHHHHIWEEINELENWKKLLLKFLPHKNLQKARLWLQAA